MELLNFGFFGGICMMGILSAALLDSCDDANIDAFLQNDEAGINFKRKMFNNPRYLKAMKILLPFFDRRGLLDIK